MFIAQQIPLLIMGMDYSLFSMKPDFFYILITTFYCFFCVGFSEELIFRGVLISFFQKKFRDFRVSIYLSALLFGISYYLATHDIGQAAYFFVLGIIFGYLRIQEPEKFTLFSLILAHFLFNIFSNLIV